MAKIPNQSNIVKTIQSEVDSINAVVDIVVKASTSKSAKAMEKNGSNIAAYSKNINNLFSKEGVVTTVLKCINTINKYKAVDSKKIKELRNSMDSVIEFINSLSGLAINPVNVASVKMIIKPAIDVINSLKRVFKTIDTIQMPKWMWFKIRSIKGGTKKIIDLIDDLSDSAPGLKIKYALAMLSIQILSGFTGSIAGIFNNINSIQLGAKLYIKLLFLPMYIKRFKVIAKAIRSTTKSIANGKTLMGLISIGLMFNILETTFASLNNSKITLKTLYRLFILPIYIRKIKNVVKWLNKVSRMISRYNSIKDTILVALVFKSLEFSFMSINNMKLGLGVLWKLWRLPKILKRVIKVVRWLNIITRMIQATGTIKKSITLIVLFLMLEGMFASLNRIKLGLFIKGKIKKILKTIISLNRIIKRLNRMRPTANTIKKVIMLSLLFTQMSVMFTAISTAGIIGIVAAPALLLIWGIIKLTGKVLRTIVRSIGRLRAFKSLNKIASLIVLFTQLTLLFTAIVLAAPLAVAAMPSMLIILGALKLLKFVLKRIPSLIFSTKIITRIVALSVVFIQLSILFAIAIITAPLAVLAVPALLLIAGCLFVIRIAFNFIVTQLGKMARKKAIKGMAYLIVISGMFLMLGLAFLLIAIIAKPIVKQTLYILGLLGVIVMVVVLTAVMGFLFGLAAPFFVIILVGLLLMLTVIGILTLMAVMLRIIQAMNLNKELIVENINIILDTTMLIIEAIFNRDDKKGKKSDKTWIASLVDFIGGSLKTIIQAVLAVAFLAVMVAAILFIFVIAMLLGMIQLLNLNPDKVMKNVNLVLNTAILIVDTLFGSPERDSKESNKSWLGSLLEWLGGTFVTIIKAIFAVAFLAVMVAAIALILVLATMLRLLQVLDLDANTIQKNVDIVITTAVFVVDALFNRDTTDSNASDKPWIVSLIEKLASGIVFIAQAIMAVQFLAIAIGAILLIIVLAQQLRRLQDIPLDASTISNNIAVCIESAQGVVDAITNRKDKPDNGSKKSWIRSVLEFCGGGGILNIIDAIMAMAWLGFSIAIISLVKILAEQLSYIAQIDLPKDITGKVNSIANCANQVIQAVMNRKDPIVGNPDNKKMKLLKWLFPKISEAAEMMSKMRWVSSVVSNVGIVHQIATALKTLNDLPDLSIVKVKAKSVCDVADEIARMIIERTSVDIEGTTSKLKFLERINTVVKSLGNISPMAIKRSNKAIEGHTNFLDKLNKMDMTKLETATKMFEHLAEFSRSIKGDFKELAKVFNEDLMPILEETRDLLRTTSSIMKSNTTAIGKVRDSKVYDAVLAEMKEAPAGSKYEDAIKYAINRLYWGKKGWKEEIKSNPFFWTKSYTDYIDNNGDPGAEDAPRMMLTYWEAIGKLKKLSNDAGVGLQTGWKKESVITASKTIDDLYSLFADGVSNVEPQAKVKLIT